MLATAFVFILGMIITLLSWHIDRQRIDTQEVARLNEQIRSIEMDITNRLVIYEQILRGASGLFSASDHVTREDWRRYIQQYDLGETYPGVSRLGFIQYLPGQSADVYTANVRQEGLSDFSIKPNGVRTEYASVTYVEPMDDETNKLLGFDIFTDPQRLDLAIKTRDSGEAGLSDKLAQLPEYTIPGQSSFTMYQPLYTKDTKPTTVEERRANLQGFVFAAYGSNDFFGHAIDTSKFNSYSAIQIFDGINTENDPLLYESPNYKDFEQHQTTTAFTANVFNQTWSFRLAGPMDSARSDVQRANMIIIGGTTISFAIAGFLFLVMLTRARAIVYSKQNETQQAKDDLLSLASHQLRTPATAVKQYLGMILEGYTGKISKKQLPAIQKAYASNERQIDTINQILYVAKADAGRLSVNRQLFDINILLDDIVLDLSDTLEENEQSIVIDRPEEALLVNADESCLRMVIENVISNASKYSHPKTQITVKTSLTNNNEVIIAIIDQGVGIEPEDYDKLFKKFSRLDNDRSLEVGGSGIGLYIDKVLIELHGGRIEFISEVGVGSTFTIILPQDSNYTANNLTDHTNNNSP